jgi:PAS domain S-box-containing protein
LGSLGHPGCCVLKTPNFKFDPATNFSKLNSEYAEQYGGTREEMLSINPHLNYADSKDRDRLYHRLAQDGQVDGMNIQMRRKDGSLWWARCTWLPVEFEGVQGHIGWMVEIDQASAVVKIA